MRSRVVRWTTHSRSRSCWIPNATAIAPIRTRAIAESLTFTTSTPAALRVRAASRVRSIRTERGGSISTETTNRPAASAAASRVGGGASPTPCAPGSAAADRGCGGAATATRGAPAGARDERVPVPRSPGTASRASRTARMAATWAGVVPQQPPTMRAPAASIAGVMSAK